MNDSSITIDQLLGSPEFIALVISRVYESAGNNTIGWKKYLSFEETRDRTFKSLHGTVGAIRMASINDKGAPKPLRGRRGLGEMILAVADLGDRMQMDNDRLEMLRALTERYGNSTVKAADIVNFLVQDFQELAMAPHKRIDKILGDLISTGESSVKISDNPKGIQVLDMSIPIIKEKTQASDKGKLLVFLQNIMAAHAHLNLGVIEMNRKTFVNFFGKGEEFISTHKLILGTSGVSYVGMLTLEHINRLFESSGLPKVRINDEIVTDLNGKTYPVFADNRITFMPDGEIGKLRFRRPYEATDPVNGKTYVHLDGGMFISTLRNDEGRFIECGAEWVPEVRASKSMINIDLSKSA